MQWQQRLLRAALVPALFMIHSPAVAAQDALVLGAGGSRGLAHVGAIQGLAQKGFRPGLVVGTSIGAIMGALYASGMSADSIWELSRSIDWQELFAFPPLRVSVDGERVRPFLNLGLNVDRRRYSDGLISDRGVNRLFVRLLFDPGARAGSDFDRLPIRFRSVASDLGTGLAVTLDQGDLALAVRASMSVPGVFAPVIDDRGRYLVDGGISDYLPVATAFAAGATRVISVDVIRPPATNLGRLNPFQIALRAFRLTLHNARPDGPEADVVIEPVVDPDLSAAMFLRDATPLLEAGLRAALQAFPDSFEPRPGPEPTSGEQRPAPLRVEAVRVESNDPELVPLVRSAFGRVAFSAYDAEAVLAAADRLYATGYFDGIWPHLEPDGTLVVRAVAQPQTIMSASAGFDDDRGPRLLAVLRVRKGSGELGLQGRLGSLDSWAMLTARRPLGRVPTLSPMAGVGYRESDVRLFEGQRVVAETEVRRAGGWAGLDWQDREGRAELTAAFRSDRILRDEGGHGNATGFSLRLAGREPNARIVGAPAVFEAERRWGDIPWSAVRARGGRVIGGVRARAAVVADIAVASTAAPLDVLPALGDPDGVPGLQYGSVRGPARAVGGLDLALPVFFEGHARVRVRAGAVGDRLDVLDSVRWVSGAEFSLLWWTPFGRIAAGIGATRKGDWRASFDIGPRF